MTWQRQLFRFDQREGDPSEFTDGVVRECWCNVSAGWWTFGVMWERWVGETHVTLHLGPVRLCAWWVRR